MSSIYEEVNYPTLFSNTNSQIDSLIDMIKNMIPIVEKYPLATFTASAIGNLPVSIRLQPIPYCRLQWSYTYKTPFLGTLQQTLALQDIYLQNNIDYTMDTLVVKLLDYYGV
jgi:hypothetical protein